jgi:hypothetical protein
MITYRVDIAVDRPAADVFPYLADITHHGAWMGAEATPISEGPMRPGYRLRYLTDEGEMEVEITDFRPGTGFTARTISGPMDWSGTFEVHPEGGDTSRVFSRGSVGLSGVKRLLEPFAGGEVRRRERGELERLKALVEGGAR